MHEEHHGRRAAEAREEVQRRAAVRVADVRVRALLERLEDLGVRRLTTLSFRVVAIFLQIRFYRSHICILLIVFTVEFSIYLYIL